ncbi:MAG: OmpH family outer membrane protein [Candidatus Babeliales bacterium]
MNKKIHYSLLMAALVSTSCLAEHAVKSDIPTTMEELKSVIHKEIQNAVGFINPFEILEKSDEYKDELKRIEKELDARKAQLKSLEDTAMKKKTELETMANALSESARDRKREELVNLEAQYRIKLQGAQEYAQSAEEKARMRILKKIQDEAEGLAKEEGRIMVIAGGVIYGAQPIDLTSKVTERLNKKYKAEKEKKKERDERAKEKNK